MKTLLIVSLLASSFAADAQTYPQQYPQQYVQPGQYYQPNQQQYQQYIQQPVMQSQYAYYQPYCIVDMYGRPICQHVPHNLQVPLYQVPVAVNVPVTINMAPQNVQVPVAPTVQPQQPPAVDKPVYDDIDDVLMPEDAPCVGSAVKCSKRARSIVR
jgi:hypothetical protein